MPSNYRVQCLACSYDEFRYRNIKKCPLCGGLLQRVLPKCLCYHGTNQVNAKGILKDGFKKDTYFAIHLEDAIGYGGVYVFEVAYPWSKIPKGCWQFLCDAPVETKDIVCLVKYNRSKVIIDNMVLRHIVCISNSTEGEVKYITDDMEVNPSGYTEAELIAYGVKKSGAMK